MSLVLPKLVQAAVLKDSCGCAMGARFMILALVFAVPYHGFLFYRQELGGWPACWHAFLWVFVATGIGKVTGILLHHLVLRQSNRASSHQTHN